MFNSQDFRKASLLYRGRALTVAGCIEPATDQPLNQLLQPKEKLSPASLSPADRGSEARCKKADSGKVGRRRRAKADSKACSRFTEIAPQTTLVTVPKGTAISAVEAKTMTATRNHAGDTFCDPFLAYQVDGKTVICQRVCQGNRFGRNGKKGRGN